MNIEFVEGTPDDIPPSGLSDDGNSSSDLSCVVCGKTLTYGGRGPKPKYCDEHRSGSRSTSRGSSVRSSRDVDAAMSALSGTHTTLSFLLMLVKPDAAVQWEEARPALDERNRAILAADPALAKRLASMAAKGGAPALVLSHLVAVAPAASLVWAEYSSKSRERKANVAMNANVGIPPEVADMPDSVFPPFDPIDGAA